MIFGSSDDKFHLVVGVRLDAGHWGVAHRQTHDGRLVTATQFASAAEFTNVPDADLTAGRGVEHGAALATQGNVVNQRLALRELQTPGAGRIGLIAAGRPSR